MGGSLNVRAKPACACAYSITILRYRSCWYIHPSACVRIMCVRVFASRLALAPRVSTNNQHFFAQRFPPFQSVWEPRVPRLAPTLWLRFLRVSRARLSLSSSSSSSLPPLPTDFYYHPVLLFNYLRFVTYVIGFHLLRLLSAPLFCTYSLCVHIITRLCTPSRIYVCIWSTRGRVRIAGVHPLSLSLSLSPSLWKSEEKQEEGEFDVIAREYCRPANAR